MIQLEDLRLNERAKRSAVDEIEPLLLTVDEAARLLGVGRSFLAARIADGSMPSFKWGGVRRIALDQLRQWVAEQTTIGGRQ